MGAPITVADLQVQNGESRVEDLMLAQALGFADPHSIRRLVRRYRSELAVFGEVFSKRKKPTSVGGRPGEVYFLNEEQAIFITAKSDTPRAAEITVEMVRVFRDYLKGELKPVKVKAHRRALPAPAASEVATRLAAIEQRLQEITPTQTFPDLPEGYGAVILNGEPVFFDSTDFMLEHGAKMVVVMSNGEVCIDTAGGPEGLLPARFGVFGPRHCISSERPMRSVKGRPTTGTVPGLILGKVVERRNVVPLPAREIAAH